MPLVHQLILSSAVEDDVAVNLRPDSLSPDAHPMPGIVNHQIDESVVGAGNLEAHRAENSGRSPASSAVGYFKIPVNRPGAFHINRTGTRPLTVITDDRAFPRVLLNGYGLCFRAAEGTGKYADIGAPAQPHDATR